MQTNFFVLTYKGITALLDHNSLGRSPLVRGNLHNINTKSAEVLPRTLSSYYGSGLSLRKSYGTCFGSCIFGNNFIYSKESFVNCSRIEEVRH